MDALKSSLDLLSKRFFLVGVLPASVAMLSVLLLVWAGAPGHRLAFTAAWRTAAALRAGEVALLVVVMVLVAVLLAPLQQAMVRMLEGGWPGWLDGGLARRWQLGRWRRAVAEATFPPDGPGEPAPAEIQRVGAAGALLRSRFPPQDYLVRPTALGNVLAALEDSAGRAYGLDAAVAWPRLYPLLSDRVRAVVDDRRNTMDTAARLAVTFAVLAAVTAALLLRTGWWLLLALIPLGVAWLAYAGAVHAAAGYAESVYTAFDLHRFDLHRALHLPLPPDRAAEVALNRSLCAEWRQNIPFQPVYRHDEDRAARS